ncbi:hypothetical protein [Bifidobacterium longum]|uniref:hypothetical protein n=2 Tax=Bifidobacterium longum TaxID=216816 RepID=UPI002025852F|nr:hypothetical protein [Bifidobacterium longum]
MKNLSIRLKAYKPNGDTLGLLPQPSSFSASFLHDDTGALRLEYSRKALNGSILERKLETGLEIAVEVSDGGKWAEPLNGRFVLISRSRDALDSSDTVTFTCPSYAWLLNKALMLDLAHLEGDGDDKGKRVFKKASAGLVMRTFLDENKTRGGIPVTCGFDTGRDSAGAAWKSVMTLAYTPGISSLTALANLAGNKICDWAFDKRTLKIWNMDSTALCRDLSRISVQLAHDVLEAPEEESIEALASHILVQGDNSKAFTRDNPAAPSPWGKWETYLSQQGISDDDTAALYMQSTLDTAARVRGQYTRALRVNDAPSLPLIDYRPGDWITAPTVMHGEKVRVQQVTLSLESNQFKASVVLNDKVYDATVRQAKRVQGITGGAINGGTGGGLPAPEKDHRTPKAVTGLVVQTDAYISSRGTALGLATLQWAAVSQATDDTAIDISGYRVEYRKNLAGAPWVSGGVTDAQRLTLGIGGLECGQRYEFRVRAVPTYSDRLGEWSPVVVALVASDVTPPSVPSKPVLTSKLGVVDVQWDGRNTAGGGMEPDFDHVEVGISDSNGNWKYRDSVARDGHCIVTGLEYRAYWFALRSVDHSGNKSDWGVGASITVASAVSQDDLDRLDKDLAASKKELSQAKQDVAANTIAIENANKQLDSAKAELAAAKTEISQAKATANSATATAQSALDKANSVGTAIDGLHNVYTGPDDPSTLKGVTLKDGDLWNRTQKYWTRWSGEANNSPSLLADFYTYWLGEPNNSASVLVPLSSRIIGTYRWDGSAWQAIEYADLETAKRELADHQAALDEADRQIAANKTAISNANKRIDTNSTDIANANRELAQAKQDIAQANRELDAAQGDIGQAKQDIAANRAEIANANKTLDAANKTLASHTASIEANRQGIQSAASKAQTALDKANSVGKSLDGLHNVYQGPDDPKTLSGVTVRQGDMWYRTQKYWTRWSGEANNSPSLLADFYTYWLGEPNNSASVLVPLSSRITGVYVYDGSRWNEVNLVAANILATGSVVASNLAANSITSDKIVAGAVIADKLAANSVTAGKIAANAVNAAALVAGAITTEKLAALAVTADKLAAKAVVAGKLAANAVTAETIAAGAIVAGKLAANSVAAGNIVSGAVTADKLAANSVNADKLTANSVTADKIKADAILARHMSADSVTTQALAALSVTVDKLAAKSVIADKIAAGAVIAEKIASGAITTDKLAALAVTADKLAANIINAGHLVSGAVTADKLAANSVDASKIVAQSVTGDRIASNTIVARNIAAQSITSDKVAAGQFVGYVFTGSIFQSSTADNTGWKLKGNALDMWDSKRNHTVHLDGEGANNLLTGTFQTSLTGRRVVISPTFRQSTINSDDKTEGSGIEFQHGRDGRDAYIASESRTNYKGEVSAIVINGGRLSDTDPGSFMRLGEYKEADNATKTGEAFLAAYRDYSKGSKSGKAQLVLEADPTSKYHTSAELSAADPNGSVGVSADINSGYLYLGGFLGLFGEGRGTFRTAYFRNGIMSGEGWMTQTYTYASPAKYGLYHAHVSADAMGSVMVGSNNDSASGCGLWARGVGNGVNIPYGTQLLAILAKQ